MTPAQLSRYGEALYGPRWPAALARDLNTPLRNVQRWRDGERRVPDWLEAELDRLLAERRRKLDELLAH